MEFNPSPSAAPISSTASASVHLPFPTSTIAELENRIVPSANPTPAAPPAPHHPPYADMICTAIAALNERNGSSRRAIAKYIEEVYIGLPATHSALLTHNLKRLKNSGLLVMVKKSYKLARSDATAAVTGNGTVPSGTQPHTAPLARGRGRPPKNKTLQPQAHQIPQLQQAQLPQPQFLQSQLAQPQFLVQAQQSQLPQQPQPPPQPQFRVANLHQQYADPILVALGLVDEPSIVQEKSPGRPRKNAGPVDVTGQVGSVPDARRRGRPSGARAKPWVPRRAGRPPKPKSVSSISNGFKRRRGRPRKVQPSGVPFAPPPVSPPNGTQLSHEGPSVPVMPDGTSAPNVPTAAPANVNGVPNVNVSRSRGRPRKNPGAIVHVPSTGFNFSATAGAGPGRGRGRGRRGRVVFSGRSGLQYGGEYMRPKTSSGRPVGRPRKFPALGTSVTTAGDLSRKLEYFQSKVKEAVVVLKPYFTNESPFAAANAFRELELLATTDLSAPLKDETSKMQPLVPPPQLQLPPESYPYPQHVPQSQPPLQQLSVQQAPSQPQPQPQPEQLLQQQPTMQN